MSRSICREWLYAIPTALQAKWHLACPPQRRISTRGRDIVLVRVERLELPRLAAPEPKSGVSTNFTIPAFRRSHCPIAFLQDQISGMPRMFWTCEGTGLPERGVSISLVSTGSKGKCNDVARDNAATPLVPHDGVGQPSSARCGPAGVSLSKFPHRNTRRDPDEQYCGTFGHRVAEPCAWRMIAIRPVLYPSPVAHIIFQSSIGGGALLLPALPDADWQRSSSRLPIRTSNARRSSSPAGVVFCALRPCCAFTFRAAHRLQRALA